MLDKFLWWKLEKGCLVYACMSTIYSILAFILSIFLYENFDRFEEHPMHLFLADAPEHILRLIFVFFSLIDIASSVLLVYGILKVSLVCRIVQIENNKNHFVSSIFLWSPWILNIYHSHWLKIIYMYFLTRFHSVPFRLTFFASWRDKKKKTQKPIATLLRLSLYESYSKKRLKVCGKLNAKSKKNVQMK